jgi:arylsulfatase A-like enzyme/tetratricopeptide (TPR) repeat protein
MTGSASGRALGFVLALAVLAAGTGHVLLAANPAGSAESRQPPDVVLVTIDTLRADALGCYGNREVETPNIDSLAREGLVFDFAHASNVVTLPSHTNILTGLYPFQHGVRDNAGFRLDPRFPTLATILSGRGYATAAFVAAFPLDSRYGLGRGFDVYDDHYPPAVSSYDFELPERPGTEVVGLACRWYEKVRGRKRFLWVHLYEPHAPYRPPAPFAERYAGRLYLGEVAAADAALAPLIRLIRQEGAGRTLVIVTGDHGEALGDHGERTHGLFAYEATLRIPLLLWCPGVIEAARSSRPARHVDILPTVLDVLAAPVPTGLPGSSLLSGDPGGADYFEAMYASLNRGWAPLTGMIAEGFKFIDLPIPELYELRSDPEEKHNLVDSRRDIVRKIRSLMPASSPPGAPRSTDPEEARRLLSLGYLSGSASHHGPYTKADDPKTLVGLDARMRQVVDLYQLGRQSAATELARAILRERPSMAEAYEFLAYLLQQSGKGLEAARVLETAIRKGLASEGMRVRLALVYSEAGKPARGLEALKPVSESDDPDTQNTIGIMLADMGRTDQAMAVFEKVLQKHPDSALTLQNMGIALLKAKNAPAALERFRRALAINEKLPRALNAKGVAEMELGDAASAMASWKRAAELDPRQYDALFNLGLVAAQNGQPDLARDALGRFIATAPPSLYSRDIEQARQMLRQLVGS